MKSISCTKPGLTCSKFSNIPYNLILQQNLLILRFLLRLFHLNLSLANEYVVDVTIPTQNFLQADQPIRLQYSDQIKLENNIPVIL